MSILKALRFVEVFFERRKFARAEADAERIASAIAPFIDAAGPCFIELLEQGVPSWNLNNEVLHSYLGYVSGIINAVQQDTLEKSESKDWAASELVFYKIVEAQLDWIPGSETWLAINGEGGIGTNAMGGMQMISGFVRASKLGARDYCSRSTEGLIKLLSLLNPDKISASDTPNISDEGLIAKFVYRSRQDHKLSDVGFFLKSTLYAVHRHCRFEGRNIVASDLVTISPWDIQVGNGSNDAKSGAYELAIRCSEPIIARNLISASEINLLNCCVVAQSILLYLIMSRSIEDTEMIMRLIRMDEMSNGPNQQSPEYMELIEQFVRVRAYRNPIDMQSVRKSELKFRPFRRLTLMRTLGDMGIVIPEE